MNHVIKGIIDSSIDLLYPKHCVSCDKVLLKIEKEMGFCKACAKKIQLVGPNYCMTCGVPAKTRSTILTRPGPSSDTLVI